jgi:hypothetical protein
MAKKCTYLMKMKKLLFLHKSGLQWPVMNKWKPLIYFQTKSDFLDTFLRLGSLCHVQLVNEYETYPYFLQIFRSNTFSIIYVFCKSCEYGCEMKLFKTTESKKKQFHVHNHVHNSHKTQKSTLLWIGDSEENIDYLFNYLKVSKNCQFLSPSLLFM